jgi:alpha-glucosidase
VVANTGQVPVELPLGTLLASSGPVTGGSLPADTTVWLKLAE